MHRESPAPSWELPAGARMVLDALADGATVTDATVDDDEGPRILYVNDALCRMTGYARDELVGRSPKLLQGPATDRFTLDRLRAALAQEVTFAGQAVNYRKDGRAFVVEWTVAPIREHGRLVAFIAIQRDVTALRIDFRDAEQHARSQWLTLLTDRDET